MRGTGVGFRSDTFFVKVKRRHIFVPHPGEGAAAVRRTFLETCCVNRWRRTRTVPLRADITQLFTNGASSCVRAVFYSFAGRPGPVKGRRFSILNAMLLGGAVVPFFYRP